MRNNEVFFHLYKEGFFLSLEIFETGQCPLWAGLNMIQPEFRDQVWNLLAVITAESIRDSVRCAFLPKYLIL